MKGFFKTIVIGLLIGIILFILENSFRIISGGSITWNLRTLHNLGLYILYSIPLSLVNGYLFDYFNSLKWERNSKYRFWIGLFGSVFVTLFTIFVIRIIHRVAFQGLSFEEFFSSENPQFYFIALLITLVIALFFHVIHFYRLAQEKKVTEQKIIAGTASAQFESLKNQIDPHFLFNSLNVLTSLIEENPDNAQKFTTSLSKIYRYVLEQKDKELIEVEEELRFASTYMELLKMRFEGSVFYEAPATPENPDAKVVPLSLQLLLENTVKHNVVSENRPLYIRIYEEAGYLVVENNLQKKEIIQSRQGVGLKNIEERYSLVTSRKVLIEEDEDMFKVRIPLLTKQIVVMEAQRSNKENAYFTAKARVKEMKEFYGNLLSYCLVIPFLIFINYRTYWEFQWFWFPLLGWGLGLTIHAFTVFGYGAKWEENKIREIMEKEEMTKTGWK
ncbi:histidine kinase [Antarcticibacterium flavum]|uniref:Histidine kinase n=1 Tax=Antarcticibacterium flavum TaxID=2058175 RepID=A0A5B7X9B7_9FLAO|nr:MULTISPECIES: histidine kinase [Antarcticibacterium]MCM4160651.1 histidine kinase [Antarcticibacterium sp. W02-3]QCY71201.1 histidine kinase [Antarcticibacterium flavum]